MCFYFGAGIGLLVFNRTSFLVVEILTEQKGDLGFTPAISTNVSTCSVLHM